MLGFIVRCCILISFFLCCPLFVFGQLPGSEINFPYNNSAFKDKLAFKFLFPFPSLMVGAQYNIVGNTTIESALGYNVLITSGRFYPRIMYVPYIKSKGKYYYSTRHRITKGRNIEGFSGNYFMVSWDQALHNAGIFPHNLAPKTPHVIGVIRAHSNVAVGWGLQRTFGQKKNWFVDFGVIYGLFYGYGELEFFDFPGPHIGFGYMLR